MSEGLGIFETATRELRAMHNEGNLMKLGKVSGDYYWAEQEIDRLQQELAATLSKEAVEKLNKLEEGFTWKETVAGEIFYKQGFADGVSLVMQSLMWQSVRQ
ncbi:hypothetical protein Ga0466249_000963 [Sporomusaceae bacterium BoRhaA]|uniref:hypothetical protein n=1 Tax=Pelorhabdus rhamnosifermentans TaxID=2772457 RepID=UPI001FE810DD|nr:hypothetical protein [Pelorhabdus rhamnosifermentans]MBU2699882.1 hypothetical protein [Pelorhabdus rhamnosifermentans]